MKKTMLSIVMMLCFVFVYTQNTNESSLDINSMVRVPNSPEAEAFIKYGNTPINYFNGTANINIPIYTIKGREFSFPISLNYDSSGLKVGDVATKIGAGWNLNDSGYISRVVVGEVDGSFNPGTNNVYDLYVSSFIDYVSQNGFFYGTNRFIPEDIIEKYFSIIDLQKIKKVDLAADYFQISVPGGIQGTIFIDYKNNKANFINNPAVKVQVNGLKNGIQSWLITNTDGTQYFFEEPEITKHFYSTSGTQQIESNRVYNSSWKLSKILSPNRIDLIEFIYDSNRTEWQKKEQLHNESVRIMSFASNAPYQTCQNSDSFKTAPVNEYSILSSELKSIKCNNKEIIEFIYSNSDRADLLGKKALTKITIKDPYNNIIKGFKFYQTYFGQNNSYNSNNNGHFKFKLKLDQLELLDKNSNKISSYTFSYYKADKVPARNSKDIDFWGYFNGANNSHLFPKYKMNSGLRIYGADRDPVLETSMYGILNKITYPTGGEEHFSYDLHQLKEINDNTNIVTITDNSSTVNSNSPMAADYCDDFIRHPKIATGGFVIKREDNTSNIINLNFQNLNNSNSVTSPGYGQQYIIYKTSEEIKCPNSSFTNCTLGDEKSLCDLLNGQGNIAAVGTYNNPNTSKILISGTVFENGNYKSGPIHLSEGTYRFVLLNSNPNISMTLSKSRILTMSPSELVINKVGGLRVKEIISKTPENKALTKIITYKNGVRHHPLRFYEESIKQKSPNTLFKQCKKFHFYPNLLGNSYSNSPVTYSIIEEQILDPNRKSVNGRTEYNFYNNNEYSIYPYPINKSPLNGHLKRVRQFNEDNKLIFETTNIYETQSVNTAVPYISWGLKVKDLIEYLYHYRIFYKNGNNSYLIAEKPSNYPLLDPPKICLNDRKAACLFFPNSLIEHKITPILLSQKWSYLKSESKKEFYENDTIINTTKFTYENSDHYQLTETLSSINNQKELSQKNYYAHDLNNQVLIGQHRIGEVLKSEKFQISPNKTKIKLNTTNTLYKKYGDLYLPEKIQTSKGNIVLEDRVIYHSYDNKGNPTEVSKKDGTHIVYIWGYNQTQPVAKIENATLSDIPQNYIDNIQNASNLDNDRTIDGRNSEGLVNNYLGKEGQLRLHLNKLFQLTALKDAHMTFYTYDPLIGVTSITSSIGNVMYGGNIVYYQYDDFNRLKYVKDKNGNILKENQYNYKN